jgi:hypothetical protein
MNADMEEAYIQQRPLVILADRISGKKAATHTHNAALIKIQI